MLKMYLRNLVFIYPTGLNVLFNLKMETTCNLQTINAFLFNLNSETGDLYLI